MIFCLHADDHYGHHWLYGTGKNWKRNGGSRTRVSVQCEGHEPQRLLCGPDSLLRAAFTSMVKGTRGRSGGERKAKSKEQEQAGSGARSANVTAFPSAEMFVKMSIFYVAASSCTAHVFVLTIPVTPEIPAWMRYAV